MRPANVALTGSRRYGPLAARATLAPPPLAAPVVRWNTELGHAVRAVAWLPDHSAVLALTGAGQLVHLGGADGRAKWSEAGGSLCLSVCPTAPVVATGHLDGTLRLRNAQTGKLVSQQRVGPAWVEHVGWSPDGRWLAAAAGSALCLFDEMGRPVGCWEHPGTYISGLSWRADSGAVATASGTGARWVLLPAAGTGAPLPSSPLGGGPALVAVAWSPTGRHVAAGCVAGGVMSWQLASGAEWKALGRPGAGHALSWHHTGRQLAAAHGRAVGLWEAGTDGLHGLPKRLVFHPVPVQQVAFQHRGDLLASADDAGTLALWQPLRQRTPLSVHGFGSGVTALSWMANDCCLSVGTVGGQVAVLSAAG